MTDFSQIKFRASSWGNLLTDPVTKAAKEAGELSETCKKELVRIYCQEVYGRRKDITTAAMEKGKAVEADAIQLYSLMEGEIYYKNEEELENDFFRGHPDIFRGDNIQNAETTDDIKCSWEIESFMPKLMEEPDKGYVAQLNVYYDLTGAKSGSIVYCLMDCPAGILEAEKRSLLYKMNVISEDSPEYKRAAAELEKLLTFPDIPPQERIIKKPVAKDPELIQKMKAKCPIMRNWLQDFHAKHLSLYPK